VAKEFAAKNGTNADAIKKVAATMFGGAAELGTKGLGREVNPLVIPQAEMKALHQAVKTKQGYQTEVKTPTPTTVSDLLPATLQPGIVDKAFEGRLLDHLPVQAITAPSLEYIKYNSGGSSGAPAITAEGAAKPEVILDYTNATVTPQKIAGFTSATREALTDYDSFAGYLTGALINRLIAVENGELLTQTGTSGHLNGLVHQAGLSHARPSTLTGGYSTETSLDALELAIGQMRAGSELCSPDLFVVHPTTWSTIRRRKDAQQRYLFAQADATAEEANTIWGVPVFVTTDMTAGTGLFINRGFGYVVVREGISVSTDPYSQSTNNVTLFIAEERIGVAVERPNRLLAVTNLATDASDA
jgi:HK97 family phage major capsid protein